MLKFILLFLLAAECYRGSLGMLVEDKPTTKAPPGGQVEVNISDPHVLANAKFAVRYVNYLSGYSGMTYSESLAGIDRGTEQVVDGSVFRLTIHIGTSFCTNNDLNENRTDCPIQPGLKLRECNVTIWYKDWENYFLMLNLSCDPKQSPDTVRQGVEVYDIKVKNSASFAVDQINRDSGYSPFDSRQQLALISNGTEEVLDGVYYSLSFFIGPSRCPNIPLFNNATIEQCPLIPHREHRLCLANVVYRPWSLVDIYTVESIDCKLPGQHTTGSPAPIPFTDKPYQRRSLSIDPSDPFYIKGAEYAINQMNALDDHTGFEFKLALANVTSGSYMPYGYSRRIHLDIAVGDSECKYTDTTTTDCPLQEQSKLRHCTLSMDYHFLMQRYVLHDHHCDA